MPSIQYSIAVLCASVLSALSHPAMAQVARPVGPDKTASSRVVVAVQPVGRVPYDGITVPLVSPDGRYVASQSGRTPSWDTIFAGPDQASPVGIKITVARIDYPDKDKTAPNSKDAAKPPARPELSVVEPVDPLPRGLLLGRSASDAGFLVEAPQPDGSRWIGRVRWATQRLDWLVRDTRVNAQAAMAPHAPDGADSRFAFVRRNADEPVFSLVVRTRKDGVDTERAYTAPERSQSFLFPLFSADGRTLAAFAIATDNPAASPLQLVAFDLDSPEPGLRPCGRVDLGLAVGGVHSAYQCVASLQSPSTLPASDADAGTSAVRDVFSRGLLFFSPRDSAMAWWLPREQRFLTLARGSFAAVPFQHAEFGFLLAAQGAGNLAKPGSPGTPTTGELTYQSLRSNPDGLSELSVGRQVAVVASQAIPRATSRLGGVCILLAAPRNADKPEFDVVLLAPAKND